MLRLLVFLLFLSSASFAQGDDLVPFAKQLDKTLRHLNKSESRPCNAESVTPASARTVTFEGKRATVMSEEDAQKLFAEFQSNDEIPFDFSVAGCEQRAHEMSRLLLLKGITPLKGFATVDLKKAPRLKIPHPKKKGQIITWKYHVAPVVLVEKNGKIIPYTLDPSMESQAVPSTQWKADMTKHDPKMDARLTFTPATQYDSQGYIKINFADKSFNDGIRKSLQEFKQYSKDPNGEDEYLFQLEREQERLDMIDAGY
ncbi:protein-glutamine glutaminase family protein [Bdellovibrio sp. 22V]|uniref:protein-glutamine glutaminase family protein n=1 Tax=Bdellovibrio TaxID=958 RepID=UPI00254282A0|nr:protein-glutamine glutaminase family protein [Bdellovibrio sp. 22V]WII73637.1 protein-glutamine glutaminase family protein [Bdellovibrio sp. 22V]